MAENVPYVGEIRLFPFEWAPYGWLPCDGRMVEVREYPMLSALISGTYGPAKDGKFTLPDLRGRLPVHFGSGFVLAETGGAEEITLTVSQIPAHSHPCLVTVNPGTVPNPLNNAVAASPNIDLFIQDVTSVSMGASSITSTGGSQPHTNFQPYLCVDFIISLFGIFPSPT